ncbi:MAG: hypothetical protein ACK5P4_13555 [Bacteroidota bacterium]
MSGESLTCKVYQLLYNPVLIMVVFSDIEKVPVNQHQVYQIKSTVLNSSKSIMLYVKQYHRADLEGLNAFIFEVVDVDAGLSFLQHRYMKRIYNYSKAKDANFIDDFTFEHYQRIVALFAQPKKVFLVSVTDGTALKHFPIDLCAPLEKFFMIGVRNSNKVAASLSINDEFYISSTAAEAYHQVYSLGKFGKQKDAGKRNDKIPTELLCDTLKVKLIDKIVLDYQTIFVTAVIEKNILSTELHELYHLHKLWFLFLENQTNIETVQ